MPIYEYACPSCRAEFELLIRLGEQAECPTCGSQTLEKQLSVPAAHSHAGMELPVCPPTPGTCGRPQCGAGGCQFES